MGWNAEIDPREIQGWLGFQVSRAGSYRPTARHIRNRPYIDQIESDFGTEIARLVADLTNVSQKSDGNRKQRTAIDRKHTSAADPRAKTVKLADLIDNLSDIVRQAPGFAKTYVAEKELLLQVLGDGDRGLYQRVEEIIKSSKAELAERAR